MVVTTASAPAGLFFGRLQWADSATLVILQTLLTDVERASLLVIAAYRDNEAPPEHPLWKLVDQVERRRRISLINIGPLSERQVEAWLCRTLGRQGMRWRRWRECWLKTRGNPFSLSSYCCCCCHRNVVRDSQSGQWHWELSQIEQTAVTDNVVALLTTKVSELPEAAQQILGLAACAGHQFPADGSGTTERVGAQSGQCRLMAGAARRAGGARGWHLPPGPGATGSRGASALMPVPLPPRPRATGQL